MFWQSESAFPARTEGCPLGDDRMSPKLGSIKPVGQRNKDVIHATILAVGTVCAFIGSFAVKRILQKITLRTVQIIVAVAMLLIGAGLTSGLI
jgi:uncharacterized protein